MHDINYKVMYCIFFTCCGIASQHKPEIAHFLGVRKYIGPGWKGLDGIVYLLGKVEAVMYFAIFVNIAIKMMCSGTQILAQSVSHIWHLHIYLSFNLGLIPIRFDGFFCMDTCLMVN